MKKHIRVNDTTLNYIREHSLREPDFLKSLREKTATLPQKSMQILPEQGQFISLLVKMMGAKNALEIGVFTGYSSICIARALKPGGKLVACDNSKEWTDIAQKYWKEAGVHEKVELKIGDACDTLDTLLADGHEGEFDFAFIDADKGNYENYFERCLQLIRHGGLIMIDNTLWSGKLIDDSIQDEETVALRRINKKLCNDERIDLSILPFADGITLAVKK